METKTTTINCPNCGTVIDVNDIVYHQLEQELKTQFAQKEATLKAELDNQKKNIQVKQQVIIPVKVGQ